MMVSSTIQHPAPRIADAAAPDFVVVDVETACSRVSSICQVGIVGFKDGVEMFEYETLVDPLDRFSSFNTRIHGITGDHVLGAPTFGDIHAAIDGHLAGRITVAHSFFDKGALGAACAIHERRVIETTWLDSVRVAKRAWPELSSHRLNVLTKFLGVRHKHHDALSDARAAGMVIVRAIEHTGIGLAGWLSPASGRRGPAPKAAETGPLKGERVAILGAARDGGPAGLKLLQSDMRIDLLVTDIGLPGLNGRQVADAARAKRPELPVLFMTGYAENATVANGFLEPGMQMITKPFAVEALATRIRDIIEGR